MMYESVEQIPNLGKIKVRLKRRGLIMVEDGDWEKHGPHEGMPFMVIIGLCQYTSTKEETWVAIYPHRIYELVNPCDWDKGEPVPIQMK
jgi:hypothetical protein